MPPNNETLNSSSKVYFLVPLSLLIIIAAVGFFLYSKQTPKKEDVYKLSYEEGALMQAKGDSRARYKFEESLKNASSIEEEALAKLNVGTSYLSSEPTKAVAILKEVYANTSYPAGVRAGSIDYMMQWYSSSFDIDLVENHMLAGGEPWQSFKVNEKEPEFSKRDASLSLRKATEHASTIKSTFTSEYGIAYLYSAYELLENQSDKKKVQEYSTIILERIKKGDEDFNKKLSNGGAGVRDSQYGWGSFYKALALTNLYNLDIYNDTEEIEKSYELAILYNEKVLRIGLAVNDRLYYMIFLSRLNNQAADQKIKDQINILFEKGIETDQKYKDSVIRLIKDSRYNRDLPKIAKLDQRFKDFLITLGWKE